jgi:hypothetical protein
MAHHKRRRPKSRRAGCLMCKSHKANGAKGSRNHQTLQERKARVSEREQLDDRSSDDSVNDDRIDVLCVD